MASNRPPPIDLDPSDWRAYRSECHDALDAALDYLEHTRERPVWQPVPETTLKAMDAPTPRAGEGTRAVSEAIRRDILPYATGNTHPRFFGWVHGAGTAASLIADIYASAMNANLGGRDHAPIYVERQVIEWCCRLFALPDVAGGLLVAGTSAATLLALAAARNRALGDDARSKGLQRRSRTLVGYASTEVHECAAKAFQTLGLGEDALRKVAVNADYQIEMDALSAMVAKDRSEGLVPFCIIGSAGTVNTGAVDPLDALARFSRGERLWFHVDGAYGALAMLCESRRHLLVGIEGADSIAFDFHKWMHVQYDAGCILVRDLKTLTECFGSRPDYLMGTPRGLAAGEPWFSEMGIDLSRGFRALRVWSTMKAYGTEALGKAIERNCEQALHLASRVDAHPELERLAPVGLNVVCFRYRGSSIPAQDLDAFNIEIVSDLQESGVAAPSTTRIGGAVAIRVSLTNHRTRTEDLDLLLDAVVTTARARLEAHATDSQQ